MKAAIKTVLGGICESPPLRRRVRRSALRSVNVVYYHHVGKSDPHYQAFYRGCTVDKFAADLERLSRIFDFVPLDEAVTGRSAARGGDRPILAVTFDDGFDLLRSGAMEAMDRYRVKATTFVITGCLDNRKMMWRHVLSAIQALAPESILVPQYNELAASFGLNPIERSAELMPATSRWEMKRKDEWAALLWERCALPPIGGYLAEKRPYFTFGGLREWQAAGHSVGFHTDTHPYCSRLQRDDLEHELIQPALALGRELGLKDLCLSYPFGDRLPPPLEAELFNRGPFKALFGIRGFKRRGVSNDRLERAGIEGTNVGWTVFAPLVLGAGN